MRFNNHWQVEGKHAFLGASKPHWVNYDMEKMERIFENKFKAERGSREHVIAAELIRLKKRMPKNNITFNAYVNDAIGFRMTPEVPLVFNDDFFGTADAISFEKMKLRVHDLKTGTHPGDPRQLMIYCALFCLEYRINPYDIEMICRIYQNDEILEFNADPSVVQEIMTKGKSFAKRVEEMKELME